MRILPTRWLLILLLLSIFPALQTCRIAVFAWKEAGIEHDSGWYFDMARNLAERGLYATSSNISRTADPVGDSIHYWPTLQDRDGFTYFCPGVTVGPGFIVPEALVLKAIGCGKWQYRALPMAVMFCLLLMLSAMAYWQGGALAVILLQFWLWCLPPVTLEFTYEGYAEHLALFYSLLGFCAYGYALERPQPRRLPWFFAGLFLALSFLTKTLFLASAVAVCLHLLWVLWRRRAFSAQMRQLAVPAMLGFLLPIVLFEAYRFAAIVDRFGLAGYKANVIAVSRVFRQGGSGFTSDMTGRLVGMIDKMPLLENLGFGVSWLAWPLALLACGLALRTSVARCQTPGRRSLATALDAAAVKIPLLLAWFLVLSSSHFSRHVWDVLILMMLLMAIGVAGALRTLIRQRAATPLLCWAVVLLAVANLTCLKTSAIELSPRLTYDRALEWCSTWSTRDSAGMWKLQSLVFNPIFPKQPQDELVQFLQRELRKTDRLYYIHHQKNAELPPLVGKVFFPIERFNADQKTHRGRALVILGPFQMGDWPWRIVKKEKTERILETYQKRILFRNSLYAVIEGAGAELAASESF